MSRCFSFLSADISTCFAFLPSFRLVMLFSFCIKEHLVFYYVVLSFLNIVLDINIWLITGSPPIYSGLPVSRTEPFRNCSLCVIWLSVST